MSQECAGKSGLSPPKENGFNIIFFNSEKHNSFRWQSSSADLRSLLSSIRQGPLLDHIAMPFQACASKVTMAGGEGMETLYFHLIASL